MAGMRSDAAVPSHRPPGLGRVTGRRRWVMPTVLAAVAVVGATVLVVAFRAAGATTNRHCTGATTTITVVTSAETYDTMSGLGRRWTASGPTVAGHCAAVAVVRKESSEVAAALGPNWDATRDGPRPDVWLADSSLWLLVAGSRPDAQAMLPGKSPSVASSPVVLALRKPQAQALGWPQRTFGWEDGFGAFVKPDVWAQVGHPEWAALKLGMTEPTSSTPGLAAAVELLDADGDGTLSDAELTGSIGFTQALGGLAPDTKAFFDEQANPASTVAAFPAVERDVAAYDAGNPAVPMVPVYPSANLISLDYPYAALNAPWVDNDRRSAAALFLQYLRGPAGRKAFSTDGFRGPDRTVKDAPTLATNRGFRGSVAAPRTLPNVEGVNQIVTQWTALQRQSNILVVLDTSGSMNDPVPGTPMTRLQLLQQTASAGFSLLTNRTNIGLWQFSSQLTPTTDYRELVPYGNIAAPVGGVPRLKALLGAVAQLRANGGTGLYNTAYASWKAMQAQWTPNATNAVLLITDGKDEDSAGMNRQQFIDRLTKESLPDKPTLIIGIAVGPEADADALQQMSQVTGGRTFVARDPANAVRTLVLAFAGRLH